MIIILLILSTTGLVVSMIALRRITSLFNQLQQMIGEDVDVKKLLRKLEINELRQRDLKTRTDNLRTKQEENQTYLNKSLKKVGLIRFNPYRDTGGDQSFSLCLLNSSNTGFILTTIHGREGTRVYAKPITEGLSEYDLSSEETEALKKALK